MVVVFDPEKLTARSVSVMRDHLAQRNPLCATVLNRAGEVMAINRRGLDQFRLEEASVCGSTWSALWGGMAQERTEIAVAAAFEGSASRFRALYHGTPYPTLWDVEVLPLEWQDGQVLSALTVSTLLEVSEAEAAEAGPDPLMQRLGEALHAMANISGISASSANILRRNYDDPMLAQLADGLEEAAERARHAIETVKRDLSLS
ncbi:PAS domain-containing protein [Pseudooceanicola sp. CBS1P-1]|uniref:PAS domain-containing protein n=1 Tax=Pseudooceanicola albus TaxID=2692189 RepID=A0A6L7GA92_9RHOB|nr:MULTISPECIES: PAS domain-containing protein [Pseudooceanicola]MBT9386473.1 PAS domain-containing protein [Pseudooceanicola endophyticus]MXN20507.1 PAS domain-containing protein [Pseudooceanicola albus]